ncbi:hypothetical protein [Actinomadura sp. NBRC 104425]|nr:hypothetical protein [Actinomadura sp. NBRC 104425]
MPPQGFLQPNGLVRRFHDAHRGEGAQPVGEQFPDEGDPAGPGDENRQ